MGIKKSQTRKKYSTFYLVMLILSSIGALLATLALPLQIISLPADIEKFGLLWFTFSILDIVFLALGIVGLYLLWTHQYRRGIWLVIVMYIQSALSAAVSLLYVNQLATMMSGSIAIDASSPASNVTPHSILTVSLYIAIGFSLVLSAAFVALWWSAYNSQIRGAKK